MSPSHTIQFVFFCGLSALFQHVDLVTRSPKAEFQVCFSYLAWGSVDVGQGTTI